MSTYLLEIGTEELPADLAESVISQLELSVNNDLNSSQIKFSEIRVTTTPRRIALTIEGISPFSEDNISERKGPPFLQAFQDGKPTRAAIGFAKRYNLSPENLEIRETAKGSFVFAKSIEKGKPVASLLADYLPIWISKIQGRRFMRWGKGDFRFSRPIRWIVSLLDKEVDPSTGCSTPGMFSGTYILVYAMGGLNLVLLIAAILAASMANANPSKKRRGDEEDMMDEDDWMADFMSGGSGAGSPDDVRADMESLNTSKEDKKEEKKVEEEEDIFQEKVSRPKRRTKKKPEENNDDDDDDEGGSRPRVRRRTVRRRT